MGPSKRSRSANKCVPCTNNVSPCKGEDNAKKSRQRKRKLSELLGSPWSKQEIVRFYEAYRKCRKDWKKVAAIVGNRSVEMVEALYTLNRAYLSLPEGIASVAGLVAMMTDHYSILESLVTELRGLNDELLENKKCGDYSLKDSEPFKKQYAALLVQLDEVNAQVSHALFGLKQRNKYLGSSLPLMLKTNLGEPGGISGSFIPLTCHSHYSGSHVVDIVESSRAKAQTMVNAASQDHLSSCTANTLATDHAPDSKLNNVTHQNKVAIPSELISHCLATLLIIQICTERQFPPADVVHILDSAVTSLKPSCSQNLPIYTDIQKFMGIIKNQILGFIPI